MIVRIGHMIFSIVNKVNVVLHLYLLMRVRDYKITTSASNIKGIPRLRGKGRIIIERGVSLNCRERFNPIGGDDRLSIHVDMGATVLIRQDAGLSNATIFSKSSIDIGCRTKIGGGVKIYDCDFHNLDYKLRLERKTDVDCSIPVIIGDDVFVGAHSIILKGVHIGARSIIGAGSVVTKSVGEDEIWAGNPAQFIRSANGRIRRSV